MYDPLSSITVSAFSASIFPSLIVNVHSLSTAMLVAGAVFSVLADLCPENILF